MKAKKKTKNIDIAEFLVFTNRWRIHFHN